MKGGFVKVVMLMIGGEEDPPGRGLGGGREANEAPAQNRHQDEVPAQVRHQDGVEVVCGVGGLGLHDDHPDEGGGVVSHQQVPGKGGHAPWGYHPGEGDPSALPVEEGGAVVPVPGGDVRGALIPDGGDV